MFGINLNHDYFPAYQRASPALILTYTLQVPFARTTSYFNTFCYMNYYRKIIWSWMENCWWRREGGVIIKQALHGGQHCYAEIQQGACNSCSPYHGTICYCSKHAEVPFLSAYYYTTMQSVMSACVVHALGIGHGLGPSRWRWFPVAVSSARLASFPGSPL